MLPIRDADTAEFTGTSIKDVGTLDLNVDLERVRRAMNLVGVMALLLYIVATFPVELLDR